MRRLEKSKAEKIEKKEDMNQGKRKLGRLEKNQGNWKIREESGCNDQGNLGNNKEK